MANREETFKVATLNVHCWRDGCGYDNIERVQNLVKVGKAECSMLKLEKVGLSVNFQC